MTNIDMTKERRIGSQEFAPKRGHRDVLNVNETEQEQPKKVKYGWLWTLMFSGFYFMYKGHIGHGVLALLLAIPTSGISNVFYALVANGIVNAGR